jgi:hypothetical protein
MSNIAIVFEDPSNSESVATVNGEFYDFKDHVQFKVDISEISPGYVFDSFKVDIDLADKSTTYTDQNTRSYLGKQIKTSFVQTTTGYTTSKTMFISNTGDIKYDFINNTNYKIQYAAVFKHTTGSLFKITHLQNFKFYTNPITLVSGFKIAEATNYTVSTGDDIKITGLIVSLDPDVNVVDSTRPEYITFTFQDNDDENGDNNNPTEFDANYIIRMPYDETGEYTLVNNTLANGSRYYVRVTGQWSKGYSHSTSSHVFTVINRPKILTINVLPLYIKADEDIITVNLQAIGSGDYTPSKLWFQFKNSDNNSLVASAGGNNGFSYSSGNSYSFKLSEITSTDLINPTYLLNGTAYNLVAKAQYDNVLPSPAILYGYSDPSPVTFALIEPTIYAIAVNNLYVRNTSENIATITVSHEAYELYAPQATEGIKFVFYDPNGVEVARTNAYDFTNAAGSGSTAYPIKLSEITPGALVNNITYTVKAAVQVTNHAGTTSYVVSSESSNVTFALTEPTISAIDVVKFYVNPADTENVNTDEVIATIKVNHEAYELYAPHAAGGIKFVFYDADNAVVARTNAYPFVNVTGSGSHSYAVKRSDFASGALVNGGSYKVKAEVKLTKHNNALEYRPSDPFDVTLAIIEPTVSEINIKSLFTNVNTEIATIKVNHASYSLYSGLGTTEVTFVFYDANNVEVAETIAYDFIDTTENADQLYSIKQSDFASGALVNNTTYNVKAAVNYTDSSTLWKSSGSESAYFEFIKPVINSISAYDVQNDGGYDNPNLINDDSDQQIVATVNVNHQAYELYAPNAIEGIKFVFYDADDDEVAKTIAYPFVNSDPSDLDSLDTSPYNIKLIDISSTNNAPALTNGTPYKVKAEVKLVNHSSGVEYRLSQTFTDNVKFSQDIAPIASVTISNTWALNTDNNPSSSLERFNSSPLIGISGYFNKTAQFNVTKYTGKQLDVSTTKFRLEYKVGTGDWNLAKRAILGQKRSTDAFSRGIWRVVTENQSNPISEKSNGEYDNVVGSTVGTEQQPMVFFIPQNQGTNNSSAFTENDRVQVRVTIVDTTDLWKDGVNEASKESNSLQLINKINTYTLSSTNEPWNSQYKAYYDSNTSLLHVNVNDSIVTTLKTNIKADSNDIIQELDEGWKIVNGAAGTGGAALGKLPKVNLYYYGNSFTAGDQTSSNSFSVNQINGMGAYAVIDQHQGAKEYPFFIAYTTRTASDNKASWYKSKLFYAPQSSGDTVQDSSRAGPTLLYTGTDNPLFRPDIPASRRVKHSLLPHDGVLTNANSTYATELVNLVSLQTSSNDVTSDSGNFNFTLSETGLMTSSSVLNSYVMRFSKKLFLNIPVDWESVHADSVKVGYKYSVGASYTYKTFPYSSNLQHVTISVDPNQATTLYYSIAYIVDNVNIGLLATTQGPTTETNVPNKYFPESSDYTISASSYKTFNNDEESSITFTLTRGADSKNRLDGVNVYFTSTDSSIGKVRIGSYTTDVIDQDIYLLNSSGGYLKVLNADGNIVDSNSLWLNYHSANISFEAFRDARVNSNNAPYDASSSALDPVASDYYVESGEQSKFGTSSDSNPIWNVPVLTTPGEDGSIELSGGVINIEALSSSHSIDWAADDSASFTYDVKVTQGASTVIVDDTDAAQGKNILGNSYIIPIDLVNVAKYTVEIRKVFNGSDEENREVSLPVIVVFHTVKVDTSNMNITVKSVSNTQYVNLSWNEPVFSGSSVTGSGEESSSFLNNISAHYIKYTDSSFNVWTKLGSSEDLIERIVSPATKKQYTLPVQAIGTLYKFVMYVEAQVRYTVDGDVSMSKSFAFQVPLTDITSESTYRVSSIPSVGTNIVPTLIQNTTKPVLNLVLNANGLEDEGFISVVVILTQDGTDDKPEGEQVFLVFPDPSGTAFSFNHSVIGGGASNGDPRLAAGDESTSVPKNISSTVLSTDPSNNTYVLKIGEVQSNGRYNLSTLTMPSTTVSGFVDNSVVNYMVILTTRRGTDIGVGEFIYKAIPIVQNVYIDASGGQYFVNFTITPA